MPALSDDWPAHDPALASFTEDLRILAGGPAPEPRPGLVAVMRQGVVDPITTPGRRKMLVKTLVGSLAAKIALGMGVATASVTAAGAAGVLPDPAQHAVAAVVDAATPFALPDPSDSINDVVDIPTSSTTTTTVADDTDDTSGRAANHGACVSAVARDKSGSGSHGKTVSSVARSDCGKTSATPSTTSTTVVSSTTSTTTLSSTTSTSVATVSSAGNERTGNSGRGNSGNGGNSNGNSGNSNGNSNGGSGNSGRGNSGKG